MKSTHLVGISGKKGSGKTTLAHTLTKVLEDAEIRPLALPLKELCRDLLGIPHELLWGDDAAKQKLTKYRACDMPHWRHPGIAYKARGYLGLECLSVRQVLQQVGTEIFRKMSPTIWTDSLLREREKTLALHMLVDDVRFVDEVKAIQGAGGIVIRLLREAEHAIDGHASEVDLDGRMELFDAVVPADAGFEEAERIALTVILEKFGG